jgi:hypothetical protein
MSRKTKYPIVYVCLSPAALATAMDIAPRIIYQAIALGHLEVRHLAAIYIIRNAALKPFWVSCKRRVKHLQYRTLRRCIAT